RGSDEARIERRRALELLHHLFGFLDDAENGVAGLAVRLLLDRREDLLQPLDVAFGFFGVLLKGRFEVLVLRGLRQLGDRSDELLLGEIDVLQRLVEKFIELLRFLGHLRLLLHTNTACARSTCPAKCRSCVCRDMSFDVFTDICTGDALTARLSPAANRQRRHRRAVLLSAQTSIRASTVGRPLCRYFMPPTHGCASASIARPVRIAAG